MKLQHDLTRGAVTPQIARFVTPLIISDLIQSLYNAVDMLFVGRYAGTESLAAVSLCGPIMTVMIIVIGGLSSGVSVVISNYKGAGNQESVRRTGNTSIALYGILALCLTLAGLIFSNVILHAVQTPAEAFPEAQRYLRCVLCGMVFSFGYSLICAMQRGLGDSKSAMVFVTVASCINILLDYVFVAVLSMGAFGAALATVIAQGCSFMMGIVHFRRQRHVITFQLREIRFYRQELRSVLHVGLPTALNEVFVTIAMLTVSAVANTFGVAASAAYGVGRQIDNFAIISDGAMNSAMAAYSSQNVGAGKPERALQGLRSAMVMSGCIALVLCPFVYFFAPQLAGIFDQNPEVVALAASYLRVSVFSHVLFALVGPLIGFIRGTGNQMASVVVGLIAQYGFRVPAALIAPRFMGFSGVGIAILVGPLSSVAMYLMVVLTGRWKRGLRYLEMPKQADAKAGG